MELVQIFLQALTYLVAKDINRFLGTAISRLDARSVQQGCQGLLRILHIKDTSLFLINMREIDNDSLQTAA